MQHVAFSDDLDILKVAETTTRNLLGNSGQNRNTLFKGRV